MHFAKVLGTSRFVSAGLFMLILGTAASNALSQRPSNPAREIVRDLQFKDMNRLLEYKLLPPSPADTSARRIVLKQIGEDFHELQALNNRMMSVAWSKSNLDYRFVSDMIARIRGKASRLKGNLNFPEPVPGEKVVSKPAITTERDFREAMLLLDRTIMSFVSNPLFKNANTIEVQQGATARRDLESVLDLTADLKKSASRLGKEH